MFDKFLRCVAIWIVFDHVKPFISIVIFKKSHFHCPAFLSGIFTFRLMSDILIFIGVDVFAYKPAGLVSSSYLHQYSSVYHWYFYDKYHLFFTFFRCYHTNCHVNGGANLQLYELWNRSKILHYCRAVTCQLWCKLYGVYYVMYY